MGNDNDLNEAERFLSSLFADNKKSLPEVVDYEFSDQDGNPSLLYLMGKSGNTPMVKLLLKFGAKIDKATAAGTPLCGAVRAGHIETASLLIERSAYIMLADANHNTYLHAAAIDGQTAMFR